MYGRDECVEGDRCGAGLGVVYIGRMENGICGKEYCINVSTIRKTSDGVRNYSCWRLRNVCVLFAG